MKKSVDITMIIIILLIGIALLGLEMINGRFYLNDFKVYYLGSKALHDGQQIYGVPFGLESGHYKYSPAFLALFLPFTLLDFVTSGIIYYFIITLSLASIFIISRRMIYTFYKGMKVARETPILILGLLFIGNAVYRELHLGNINFVLLLLMLGTLYQTLKGNHFAGGLLFGLAALIKPYILFICLVLILRKKWKTLYGVTILLLSQFLLFSIIIGFGKSFDIHRAWVSAIFDHSASYQGGNDIAFLVHVYSKSSFNPLFSYLSIILAAVVIILIDIGYQRKMKANAVEFINDKHIFIAEWFLSLAMIPTIFNSDTQLFMLSFPAILLVLYYIFKRKNLYLAISMGMIFLFFGLNSNDLVGDTIGNFFDKVGAVGISNLFIIALTMIITRKYQVQKANALDQMPVNV